MSKSKDFIFKKYDTENLINRRSALLTIGKVGIFGILASRLAYLQIFESENYQSLSDKNRITQRLIEPNRGIIYDIQGNALATNIEKYQVVLIREESKDLMQSLETFEKILANKKFDKDKIYEKAMSHKKFVPINLVSELTWEEFSKLNANLHKLDGIFPRIGTKRSYTAGESHSHLIGYIAPITKDEKTNNPLSKIYNAKSGKIGIEKANDVKLRGLLGTKNVEVNSQGREIRELSRIDSIQGKNIQLTIDSELQDFCYKALDGQSGCVSVTNVLTGECSALVTSPSYDPNLFSATISNSKWEKLNNDRYKPLINKSISNQYPPGSTIKPFVAIAALEAGISESKTIFCNGKHEIADKSLESGVKTFHCWKKQGHGNVDLNEAIKVSCDVYFYQIAREIGINKIAEVCKRFGLGKQVFNEFIEESNGLVPNKSWKKETLGTSWMVGETLSAGIGQGYFLATAAQLSLALAQLVNGGKKINPHIVYGNQISSENDEINLASKRHIKIVQKALDDATNSVNGTSYGSRITGKYKMGGKTGTSQVRVISSKEREDGIIKNKDLPWEMRDHGLFIGYGPIEKPTYSISVIVEHGGSGSGSAAPIASKIMKYIFKSKVNLKRKNLINV